jgi:hypothetical protein
MRYYVNLIDTPYVNRIMKIRRLIFIIFTLLIVGQAVNAQNYMNLFCARYYFVPSTSFTNNNVEFNFQEYRLEAAVPITLKNGNIFGFKPTYKTLSLTSDDASLRDLKLYTIKAPVFAYIKWGKSKWASYFELSPKLNSDLKNINNRHYQIGATTLEYLQTREGFFWQFGLYYNQDTYGPFVMPLFGIDWKIDEKNYLSILLPCYGIYERKISPKLYTGIEIELYGETFRLGGSDSLNSYISQVGENKLTFLTEPRLFLDFYVAKHLVLYLKPGVRLFQKYEQFTENDVKIINSEYLQGVLKPCFYMEAGLAFRFRYDEEEKQSE